MASKFSQFLQENKLDPRRLMAASKQLEQLRPEDRKLKLQKRQARGKETPEGQAATSDKRRSGRPVTPRLIQDANAGKPVSGKAKSRLVRAVNRLLEQKKKEPVELRTLF